MQMYSLARRLIALRLTRAQSRPRSVSHNSTNRLRSCRAPRRAIRRAPRAVRGPIWSANEEDIHNCGTHTCIWLGPSPV
eukprot:6136151-Pyramimonas_sp.AAC.1